VQALASVLYDLRNASGLTAVLDTKRAAQDVLFDQHLGHTTAGDVLVLDRRYADSAVVALWLGHRRDVVIRFPRGSFKQVQCCWESDDTDTSVQIAVTGKQRHCVRERGLPEVVRIRLVKVVLASGEIEVLGTRLLNLERYPGAELKQVYGWRWGVETYVDRLKNLFDLERFSGTSVQCIEQDFDGLVFLATLESVLSIPAKTELANESQAKGQCHRQQVNRAVRYGAVLAHIVTLLIDRHTTTKQTLETLHALFKTKPSRHRPGRKVPRTKTTPSQRVRFYRYTKRCIA
jgi:hypothetical protein